MAILPLGVGAQDAASRFKQAEYLYQNNQSAECIPLLEAIVQDDPANMTAVLYLGLAYQQQGRYDDSIELFRKNLAKAGDRQALFAFDLGNAYYAKKAVSFAEQYYTQAVQADPGLATAYLSRANARVKTQKLKEAVQDYTTYLELAPNSPKRGDVERMIAAINEGFAIEERQKAAKEAADKEAEAKRKKLLDEVAASLQSAAEATKGVSAGTDDVQHYDGEFELQ